MEKQALVEMIDLFKEVFIELVSHEYKTLCVTISQKQKFITLLNRGKVATEKEIPAHSPNEDDEESNSPEAVNERNNRNESPPAPEGLFTSLQRQLKSKLV